jgi:hypothetical protein
MISTTVMSSATTKAGVKHELLFNKPASGIILAHPLQKLQDTEASLLNKRLMLSSSFRCDQFYNYTIYNFGHILLCYVSQT